MATTTTEGGGGPLLRLMAWLSPAFPVGSFSYSHGIESAVHDGLIADRAALQDWIASLIELGSGWNDAVLFAAAWRFGGEEGDFSDVADLAEALAGSSERHLETTLQGAAFLQAAAGWPHAVLGRVPANAAYPVAVGAVAGAHAVPLEAALAAFLQAFATNLVQAAIRLGVTGQTGGVETVAVLEPLILATARRAAASTLDDLGTATIASDITAMNHETQTTRLFRS
jgi:urease accessory protein